VTPEKMGLKIDFLGDRVQRYIRAVHTILQEELKDDYVSLILFGSTLDGIKTAEVADADLICIVSNSVSEERMNELRTRIYEEEVKARYASPPKNFIEKFAYYFEHSTGMFVNFFISKESDFIEHHFEDIFQVNSFLGKLLAPGKIVYGSMLSGSKIISGKDVKKLARKKRVSIFQVIKSMIMNLATSTCALLVNMLSDRGTKYELEALKWSLYASFYSIHGTRPSMIACAKYFFRQNPALSKKYFKQFIGLRYHFRRDMLFSVKTILNVIKIHIPALKYTSLGWAVPRGP